MGVYSTNRSQLGSYSGDDVVANENYSGEVGIFQIMTENLQNDQAIFEAVLTNDFKEAIAAKGGAVLEAQEILNEAGGFLDKIKEFLKKCWEKIKGIFKSFIAKINSILIRDNKEFVNKYKKEVLAKDLSKMKYKWADPDRFDEPKEVDALEKEIDKLVNTIDDMSDETLDKTLEDLNSGDYMDRALSVAIGESTTSADFNKDLHKKMFKDKDSEEGLDSSRLILIINVLTDSAVTIKNLNKLQKDSDKLYSDRLKSIDKLKNALSNKIPGKSEEDKRNQPANVAKNKLYNVTYKVVQVEQTAMNKIVGAYITEVKGHVKQCRRVFAQAAAFNPKSVKESAILVEAAGDAAEYEVMSSFADYSL